MSEKSLHKIDVGNLATIEPLNDIEVFLDFCHNDIQSAIAELNKIKTEANRKHLQKLVYVNLVDRFDYLVDKLLLWLSINNPNLREEILRLVDEEPISKKEVFEIIFMKDRSYETVVDKMKDLTRGNLLRQRHSVKLCKILDKCLAWKAVSNQPRVGADGKIFAKTQRSKEQPNSIIGYADWLYSRRNSYVHGDGKHYSPKDFEYIQKTFMKGDLSTSLRLKLASIKSAVTYYTDLLTKVYEDIETMG
ncbi:MAG: hypothetical protein WC553_01980 [Patescibacteria group bacterium]